MFGLQMARHLHLAGIALAAAGLWLAAPAAGATAIGPAGIDAAPAARAGAGGTILAGGLNEVGTTPPDDTMPAGRKRPGGEVGATPPDDNMPAGRKRPGGVVGATPPDDNMPAGRKRPGGVVGQTPPDDNMPAGRKRPGLTAPLTGGILETDSGFGAQGPAAIGAPAAGAPPAAPGIR